LPALTPTVDSSNAYQEIEGFRASITDSSVWLLYSELDTVQRKELMAKLFDPVHGIGLSFIRRPLGASDFALDDYSYDDLPPGQTDPDPSTAAMTVDYVAMAHVSKFVVPGAYRIESNTFEQGSLEDVAFRNPDGSIVLLVLNGSNQLISFNLEWRSRPSV
jgi:O-glycosyl hydrolase